MAAPLVRGVHTALVVPFDSEGGVAWEEFDGLVERQIAAGVDGIAICGSTGEPFALSNEERRELLRRAIARCRGRCLVIAGTGFNCTKLTVEETRFAKDAGADVCMVVNPYYNKPQQAGLIRHFQAVAAVGLPILLYNNVGRSACRLEIATIRELAKVPEIVGIKDVSGSMDICSEVCAAGLMPVLNGGDHLTLPMMAVGAVGVVSVASNICPERIVAMVRSAAEGDFATAKSEHQALLPLFDAACFESSPVPTKHALWKLGLTSTADARAPLAPCSPEGRAVMDRALVGLGLSPSRLED